VEDIRWQAEIKDIRLYIKQRGVPYFLDIDLHEQNLSFERCDKYEDKSIFKFEARFSQYFEQFSRFLDEQDRVGSTYAFPEKDP